MTQAFNLSQFANNLDPQGRVDAADGLVNAVPITNGGTGATSAAAARTNLGVPTTGGQGASGTWPISVTGTSSGISSSTFTVGVEGSKLVFKFQGTPVASIDSAGNFVTIQNITAYVPSA